MEFNAENLERAVIQFYHNNPSNRSEAHEFLTAAKGSPQAWAFIWELLEPTKATEVQFYAATTLHTKVEKSLDELSQEQCLALRERLLTSVVAYSTGPKIVLNRLCIALSAFLLRTCPETWKDAIQELLHTFTLERLPNIPVNKVIWMLLEILTLIPEEFSCMHFSNYKKGLLRNELLQNAEQVVGLLESVLANQPEEEVTMQAIKCVGSWATFGVLPSQLQTVLDLLVALTFNSHKVNSSICEKSLEVLSTLFSHPMAHKYPNHLLDMLVKLLALREIIAREVLSPDGPDKDIIKSVYNLLITFGEMHSQLLLVWLKAGGAAQQHVMALVTALLHCSGAPGSYPVDEAHSRLAFGFWYTLQDSIMAWEDSVEYEQYMALLGPIYKDLVNVLISKAELPAEHSMSKDDAELFRCYRQDIGDTMMYCYSILRDATLCLIKERFEKGSREEMTWEQVEACLFSLCSIAENVDLEETTYLPTLFQYIRHLPFDRLDPKVLATALDTVGAYAEWIAANSMILEHILPLIPLGLNVAEAAPNATMALKDLTRDCINSIQPYSSLILNSSQLLIKRVAWSRKLLQLGRRGVRMVIAAVTGHGPFKKHLFTIAARPTEGVGCRHCEEEEETAMHLLLRCPALWRSGLHHLGSAIILDEVLPNNLNPSSIGKIMRASKEALHSGRLKLNDGIRLMYSVGRLLSALPAESLYPSLEVIVSPYFTQLNALSSQQPTPENKINILTCLKMLGTITAALDTRTGGTIHNPHPALVILHRLLPLLKMTAAVWSHDTHVMQSVYVVLKHSVSNLLDDSEPAVGDILQLIVSSYRVCPEPTALDLARQLCLLFGKEEKCLHVMQDLMRELCTVTMAVVSSASNLSEKTDLLQEFFILLSQIVKKIPQILIFGSNCDCMPLVQCAIMTLGVPELPTVKAATAFLVNFIIQSREFPQLSNVVNACGEQLVQKIIALIGGEASRNNVEPLADILLALNKKYCDNHARWLNQSICEALCPKASPQQREHFIKMVLRDRSNKRKLQEHVQEFTLICRGLIGAEVIRTISSF